MKPMHYEGAYKHFDKLKAMLSNIPVAIYDTHHIKYDIFGNMFMNDF